MNNLFVVNNIYGSNNNNNNNGDVVGGEREGEDQQNQYPAHPLGGHANTVFSRLGRLHDLLAPETMILTPAETDRALAIKAAVEADDRLSSLSDFDYGQYALTLTDLTIPEIVEKIYLLQCLLVEYEILDTVEDGVESISRFQRQHPNNLVGMEFLPIDNNLLLVKDLSQFFPSIITTPEHHQIYTKGDYYVVRAMGPTFQSIRAGMCAIVECNNVTRRNISFAFHERIFTEVHACGLSKVGDLIFLNTPMIVNMAHALWKKFLTPNMKQKFRLGFQLPGLEGQSISPIFQTPTPEIARQRLIQCVQFFLMVRDHNKRTFRLPQGQLQAQPQPQPQGVVRDADDDN